MDNIRENNGHKDFSVHMPQETDCSLSPNPISGNHAHFHAKVSSFNKECSQPSLAAVNENAAYISDSEIG